MARKHRRGGRKGFRKYLKGIVNTEITFSGLGAKGLNSSDMPDVVVERTFCTSMLAAWTMANFTPVSDAGPIMVGVAHNDYSNAEIEQYIENVNSWNEGDLVQQEISKRKIRIIGIFETPDASSDSVRLNDGLKIHTKIGWYLMTGQTLKPWVYNLGANSVATTTPRVNIRGHVNLWP